MLKVFRDNLKYLSWVLWLVIAVFILFVFVDFGGGVPKGRASFEAAARVGPEKISFAEFKRSYRQTEEFYRRNLGDQFSPELARQMRLPLQVLERLVNDRVLLVEARRVGLRATDAEVRRTILETPAFQNEDGTFAGEEIYERVLRTNGYTVAGFEAEMRQQILIDKLRTILTQNLYLSEDEVEQAYREGSERAKIRFIRMPSNQLAEEVKVEEAELATYFESRREDFRLPERRAVEYLLVDSSKVQQQIRLDEEEIRNYYDANRDEFSQEEQVKARHILLRVSEERSAEEAESELAAIRRRIEQGEDFAALAQELSDDPGSKGQGGDLGFFGRGQMIEEFERAAFAAQPGELVGPIRTAFGYHLLEVLDRRSAGVRPLDEVADQIRNRLLAERARALSESKARDLAERIDREGSASADTLRRLAESDDEVVLTSTEPFGREDNVPGIGRATAFTLAAFELEPGQISEPIQVPRGWAILRLDGVQEPRLPSLEEVEAEVRQGLVQEKQSQLAQARLEQAREQIDSGASLDEVAEQMSLEVEESGQFARDEPISKIGVNPGVAELALSLDEGGIGGPLPYPQGWLLFEVVERKRFDRAAFEEEKAETRAALEQERLGQLLASIVERRRSELEIAYNPQLLETFELDTAPSG